MEAGPFIHYISICFQNVLLARCAWPSDSRGKWKPISCRGAPLVPSVKSYYHCCYASPVTSNPIDAERNGWCLPETRSTVQLLQRSSLMGGLADKGQERWHWWQWCGKKWKIQNGGLRKKAGWQWQAASNYISTFSCIKTTSADWQAMMLEHQGIREGCEGSIKSSS